MRRILCVTATSILPISSHLPNLPIPQPRPVGRSQSNGRALKEPRQSVMPIRIGSREKLRLAGGKRSNTKGLPRIRKEWTGCLIRTKSYLRILCDWSNHS